MLRTRATTLHPEAVAWAKAAAANGGLFTSRTLRAVSTLAADVARAGIRDRFVRLNLCCGNNVQAAVVPLFRSPSATGTQYGSSVDSNNGPFVTNVNYTQATGFVADSICYLDPGLTVGNLASAGMDYNEAHTSIWFMGGSSPAEIGGVDYWACYGANGSDGLSASATDSSGYMTSVANGGDYDISVSSGGAGLHLASRSSGAAAYAINGAASSVSVNSGGGAAWGAGSNMPLAVLGTFFTDESCNMNMNASYTGAAIGAYSFGLGMGTSGMRSAWYSIMLAFQKAIGRA